MTRMQAVALDPRRHGSAAGAGSRRLRV